MLLHCLRLKMLKKGDRVVIGSLNKQAVVQGPANKDGMVEVMAGVIKTRVHISDLYQDIAPAPKQKQSGGMRNVRQGTRNNTSSAATRTASMEINVIGQTVDEAIIEVDRFLDNCFMNRQHTVYVIHGKGTGALRSAITDMLRHHPHARSFRAGKYGEGEAGVTVVEIK